MSNAVSNMLICVLASFVLDGCKLPNLGIIK